MHGGGAGLLLIHPQPPPLQSIQLKRNTPCRRGSKNGKPHKPQRLGKKEVYLVASGDLRLSANQKCWPAQKEMEDALTQRRRSRRLFHRPRASLLRANSSTASSPRRRKGWTSSPASTPRRPSSWPRRSGNTRTTCSSGLITHRGPILTVANWSGTWPGLVGMLNLNGSLTKAGVKYSTLWSEDFTDEYFRSRLHDWLKTGKCSHKTRHVVPLKKVKVAAKDRKLGKTLAQQLQTEKAIMGVFDEGCMGMFNAIIPDHLLNPTGVYKERLSQSALYYESTHVSDDEANAVRKWMEDRGMKFHTGPKHEDDLTDDQIRQQCKMYIAAVRIADDFGCDCVGIQYQQGLKDLMPASDLVEGTLNNAERPPVKSRDGKRELFAGEADPALQRSRRMCRPRRAVDLSRPQGARPAGREHAARRPLGRLGPLRHGQRLRVGLSDQRLGPAGPLRRLAIRRRPPPAGDVFPQRRQHAPRRLEAGRDRLVADLRRGRRPQNGPGPRPRRRAAQRRNRTPLEPHHARNGPSCTPSPTA